jgi:hypothetical protein
MAYLFAIPDRFAVSPVPPVAVVKALSNTGTSATLSGVPFYYKFFIGIIVATLAILVALGTWFITNSLDKMSKILDDIGQKLDRMGTN